MLFRLLPCVHLSTLRVVQTHRLLPFQTLIPSKHTLPPILQPDIHIQAFNAPLPLPQQTTHPLQPYPGPLGPRLRRDAQPIGRGANQRIRGGVEHVLCGGEVIVRRQGGIVEGRGGGGGGGAGFIGRGGGEVGARLEPVAAEVEEAAVGPVARSHKQDEQQEGTVDAGPVEEVGAHEEEEDEGWGGVGWDEEEGEPAVGGGCGCQLSGFLISLFEGVRGIWGEGAAAYLRRQNMLAEGGREGRSVSCYSSDVLGSPPDEKGGQHAPGHEEALSWGWSRG